MHDETRSRVRAWAGWVFAVSWLLACGLVHAQVNAGGLLREIQGTPGLPRPDEGGIARPLAQPGREIGDIPDLRLDVTGFVIDGVSEDEAAVLQPKLAAFTGKDRSFQDLLDAAGVVKNHFNEQGYLLAQAYIPEQKIDNGIVRIIVLLGRLDRIELNYNDETPVSRARIQGYLDRLGTGRVLQKGDLERVLFLINDLHGVSARSTVRPGSEPGTADLVLDVEPDQRISGQIQFDDMGSRYTGTYRFTTSLVIGSPLGLGDSLSLRGLFAQTAGTDYGSASYVVPLGSDGLRLGASYSYLGYKLLTSEGIPPGDGLARDMMAFVLYPVVRSRNFNVFVQAGYDYQEFVDKPASALTIHRTSRSIILTLSGDLRDGLFGGGISNFSLGYVKGDLENPTADLITPVGRFQKLNPFYSRLQAIGDSPFLLFFRYAGQFTRDRLDSYQKFSLGGPNGVRAYAVGEAPGDEAQLLTAELRYPLPNWDGKIPGSLIGALFYDWGTAKLDMDPPVKIKDPPNERTLSGYGIALNWATARSWSAQASVAWRQQGTLVNDELDRRPRVYFQISRYF